MSLHAEPATVAQLRVLCALVRVYERDGRATVRDVAEEAALALGYVHQLLGELRDDGLVAWESGRKGTLRPVLVYATRVVA